MGILLLRPPGGSPANVVFAAIPAHVLRKLFGVIDAGGAGDVPDAVEIGKGYSRKTPIEWVLRHSGDPERARDVLPVRVEVRRRRVLAIDVEIERAVDAANRMNETERRVQAVRHAVAVDRRYRTIRNGRVVTDLQAEVDVGTPSTAAAAPTTTRRPPPPPRLPRCCCCCCCWIRKRVIHAQVDVVGTGRVRIRVGEVLRRSGNNRVRQRNELQQADSRWIKQGRIDNVVLKWRQRERIVDLNGSADA